MDEDYSQAGLAEINVETSTRRLQWDLVAQSAAMAIAIPAAVALCTYPKGFSAVQLVAFFGLLLMPSLGMTIYTGWRRKPPLERSLALFCLLSVATAYLLLIRGRQNQINFDDLSTIALFILSQSPAFALLYALIRKPTRDLGKPSLPIFLIGSLSIGLLSLLSPLAVISVERKDVSIEHSLLCVLYGLALVPPLIANFVQVRRERKLPVEKKDRQPDHISGVGATAFLTFVIVIVTLGLWATASGSTAMIDGMAGLIVIVGLAAAFILLAVAPAVARYSDLGRYFEAVQKLVKPLGALFSWVDSLLVFPVAAVLGASQSHWSRRYALLIGIIVPSAILGWWLAPPFGLIPLSFSLVGAIAIARRWAWVEEDRENAMLNRRFEGQHIRVGFEQDLRDETLIAFMSLLFLVPLVLRQLYFFIGPEHTFAITEAVGPDRYDAWLSFFGTELAKALPFVDWAEIYHVHGDAKIKLDQDGVNAGNHIIFATRILVDLVLLAAFLQAISITQRTSKLKDMFYKDQTIDQLDPFLESAALAKLAKRGPNGLEIVEIEYEDFPRYNEDRLEILKLRGMEDEVGFVAKSLLERYSQGGLADQVVAEARRAKPNRERLDDLIGQLRYQNVTDAADRYADKYKLAHFLLNTKTSMWPVRLGLTELIAKEVATDPEAPSPAAINALSEILIGPNPQVMDARREVRMAAINGLRPAALNKNRFAIAAINHAANKDAASKVRESAKDILEEIRGLGGV